MKTVVIVGTRAAYPDDLPPGAEVWCANAAFRAQPNAARIYCMDDLSEFDGKFIHDANATGIPFYGAVAYPDIDRSLAYPLKEVLACAGMPEESAYFTSTIAYMVAHAIQEGADCIVMHRILGWPAAIDYFLQKACLDGWLMLAVGRGIVVRISNDSGLLKPMPWEPPLYGYYRMDGSDVANETVTMAIQAAAMLPVSLREIHKP